MGVTPQFSSENWGFLLRNHAPNFIGLDR
ncbi:protein of unknown function [Candidatus Methylomirabilis oxygeniifera]|uniref:Uncharacterized protein n=1 Tax=Methylomirabilis oxygeniifera TaxID=671143 RepID=D5MHA9_METO1|nr:protein of unknown function [Candidatus Methylomirabilis oxyfera]